MQPIDFRYRMSDQGRIVLGPLSSEETLEFEVLSRRDREGQIDLRSELRLLELYVKYNGSSAEVPLAPLPPVDDLIESPLPHDLTTRTLEHAYVVPLVAVMSVGFVVIAMLIS
jgi:hypothetical protein